MENAIQRTVPDWNGLQKTTKEGTDRKNQWCFTTVPAPNCRILIPPTKAVKASTLVKDIVFYQRIKDTFGLIGGWFEYGVWTDASVHT